MRPWTGRKQRRLAECEHKQRSRCHRVKFTPGFSIVRLLRADEVWLSKPVPEIESQGKTFQGRDISPLGRQVHKKIGRRADRNRLSWILVAARLWRFDSSFRAQCGTTCLNGEMVDALDRFRFQIINIVRRLLTNGKKRRAERRGLSKCLR